MGNIFAELQMSSANSMNTVLDARKRMNEMLNIFLSRPDRMELVTIFAKEFRNLEVQTLVDCDSFAIEETDPAISGNRVRRLTVFRHNPFFSQLVINTKCLGTISHNIRYFGQWNCLGFTRLRLQNNFSDCCHKL